MEEAIKIEMTRIEAEQFSAMLEAGLKEIDAAIKRMDEYEAERLKYQAETHALMEQIKVILNVEAAY